MEIRYSCDLKMERTACRCLNYSFVYGRLLFFLNNYSIDFEKSSGAKYRAEVLRVLDAVENKQERELDVRS